ESERRPPVADGPEQASPDRRAAENGEQHEAPARGLQRPARLVQEESRERDAASGRESQQGRQRAEGEQPARGQGRLGFGPDPSREHPGGEGAEGGDEGEAPEGGS